MQMVYNLLKRHPACKVLIHRAANDMGQAPTAEGDPYDFEEKDPAKCNAMVRYALYHTYEVSRFLRLTSRSQASSLWEVSLLLDHVHPLVGNAAKLLKTPALRKMEQPVDKVAADSYATVLKVCCLLLVKVII